MVANDFCLLGCSDYHTFCENIPRLNYRVWEPELFERRPVLYLAARLSVISFIASVCHLCLFICHPYVTRMWFYH